jgi:hypothetical protein
MKTKIYSSANVNATKLMVLFICFFITFSSIAQQSASSQGIFKLEVSQGTSAKVSVSILAGLDLQFNKGNDPAYVNLKARVSWPEAFGCESFVYNGKEWNNYTELQPYLNRIKVQSLTVFFDPIGTSKCRSEHYNCKSGEWFTAGTLCWVEDEGSFGIRGFEVRSANMTGIPEVIAAIKAIEKREAEEKREREAQIAKEKQEEDSRNQQNNTAQGSTHTANEEDLSKVPGTMAWQEEQRKLKEQQAAQEEQKLMAERQRAQNELNQQKVEAVGNLATTIATGGSKEQILEESMKNFGMGVGTSIATGKIMDVNTAAGVIGMGVAIGQTIKESRDKKLIKEAKEAEEKRRRVQSFISDIDKEEDVVLKENFLAGLVTDHVFVLMNTRIVVNDKKMIVYNSNNELIHEISTDFVNPENGKTFSNEVANIQIRRRIFVDSDSSFYFLRGGTKDYRVLRRYAIDNKDKLTFEDFQFNHFIGERKLDQILVIGYDKVLKVHNKSKEQVVYYSISDNKDQVIKQGSFELPENSTTSSFYPTEHPDFIELTFFTNPHYNGGFLLNTDLKSDNFMSVGILNVQTGQFYYKKRASRIKYSKQLEKFIVLDNGTLFYTDKHINGELQLDEQAGKAFINKDEKYQLKGGLNHHRILDLMEYKNYLLLSAGSNLIVINYFGEGKAYRVNKVAFINANLNYVYRKSELSTSRDGNHLVFSGIGPEKELFNNIYKLDGLLPPFKNKYMLGFGFAESESGLIVNNIAEKHVGGLKKGDVIIRIEGIDIRTQQDLSNIINSIDREKDFSFTVYRNNELKNVIVTAMESKYFYP